MKYRVGIAGFGIVGKRRCEYIQKNNFLKLIAVCDSNQDQFKDLNDDIKKHTNYNDLLNEKLDIIFICLTNDIAPEVTIKSLKKGIHVFCEKPPGRNVEDIENVIVEEKKHKGLILKYGFNHRYHDSIILAKEKIKSGDYGDIINLNGIYGKSRIVNFDGGWRSKKEIAGGGILLDQGIHMLDLIRFFAGEFDEIKSFVSNNFWNYNVEDNAYAIMRNNKGIVAMLNSSATLWEHKFNLRISLTKGYIELSGLLTSTKSYGEEKLISYQHDSNKIIDGYTKSEYKFLEDNSWSREIDEFVECIIKNRKVKFGSSKDALESMNLVYKIYKNDNK